jgi:hypothetical protein
VAGCCPGAPSAAASANSRTALPSCAGEFAPKPARLITDALADVMSSARVEVMAGAGHMGPTIHANAINVRIVEHIAGAEAIRAVNDWMSRCYPLGADAA